MPDDLFETTVEVTVTRDFTKSWAKTTPGQAFLVVIAGPRLGHRVLLGQDALDIGRGTACGLQLDADSVSRRHARITWDGQAHHLVDLKSTNGSYVNEARISDVVLRDGDRLQIGKVLLKYLSGSNVESAYHEEIQRLMRYDGLTSIFNKSHFDETFYNAVWRARVEPQPLSLIVFDLDHFKSINDTYGHTAGDAVLRQVSSVVSQVVPQPFVFARVGGEEFAVMCTPCYMPGAAELAERIRDSVQRTPFEFDGKVIPVTLSLGVTLRQDGEDDPKAIYERADGALYTAKREGRNCVRTA